MLWIAFGVVCSGLSLATCEGRTADHAFSTERECVAWITDEKVREEEGGKQVALGCTDIELPGRPT